MQFPLKFFSSSNWTRLILLVIFTLFYFGYMLFMQYFYLTSPQATSAYIIWRDLDIICYCVRNIYKTFIGAVEFQLSKDEAYIYQYVKCAGSSAKVSFNSRLRSKRKITCIWMFIINDGILSRSIFCIILFCKYFSYYISFSYNWNL